MVAYRGCGAHVKAQQVETIKMTENITYVEAVRKVKGARKEMQQAKSES